MRPRARRSAPARQRGGFATIVRACTCAPQAAPRGLRNSARHLRSLPRCPRRRACFATRFIAEMATAKSPARAFLPLAERARRLQSPSRSSAPPTAVLPWVSSWGELKLEPQATNIDHEGRAAASPLGVGTGRLVNAQSTTTRSLGAMGVRGQEAARPKDRDGRDGASTRWNPIRHVARSNPLRAQQVAQAALTNFRVVTPIQHGVLETAERKLSRGGDHVRRRSSLQPKQSWTYSVSAIVARQRTSTYASRTRIVDCRQLVARFRVPPTNRQGSSAQSLPISLSLTEPPHHSRRRGNSRGVLSIRSERGLVLGCSWLTGPARPVCLQRPLDPFRLSAAELVPSCTS